MDRLPFTLYDVLACVVSGLVLLIALDAAFDAAFGTAGMLSSNIGLTSGIVVAIGAYILGHVVAHVSGFLYERMVVRAWLGAPEEILLHARRRETRVFFFPGYFDPLSSRERADVMTKAKVAGVDATGREVFSYALRRVRREAATANKLETFLNLYGFCRNTSFALLCAGGVFLAGAWLTVWRLPGGFATEVGWGIAAVLVSVILFYRYLKFFRLYTAEVFRAYAALDPSLSEKGA